ncbi:MAG: hypothetical protein AABY85_10450 [Gemmatimonadota bacterium]
MPAIHIQSFVASPPGQVWAALTSPAGAGVLLDGLPARGWPEPRDEQAPFHLHVAWPHTPEPTEVSVTLHELGGGTRIDLVHQGWGEGGGWEEQVQGHFAGWLQGLAALGLLVESEKDARPATPELKAAERYFASGEIPTSPSAVYRSLTDADVLERWSDGVLEGAERTDAIENGYLRWSLPNRAELVIILRRTPRGTHCALAEYGVADQVASARWPAMFERLTRFLE